MSSSCENPILLAKVAAELEELRRDYVHQLHDGMPFPKACNSLLRSIPGNTRCVDCGSPNPDWASVSYGVLLCVQCSGRHRSYGVATSRVRSVSMDAWSHSQVLAMLEGGNEQLQRFYSRHGMGQDSVASKHRYQTKAASFYRSNLHTHIRKVLEGGEYKGRAASRAPTTITTKPNPDVKARVDHTTNLTIQRMMTVPQISVRQ
jgi:hypothetical protein